MDIEAIAHKTKLSTPIHLIVGLHGSSILSYFSNSCAVAHAKKTLPKPLSGSMLRVRYGKKKVCNK